MSEKKNRPNILLAIADDASHMSAYGHDFVNTPNFDRIADEGLLFENAFTSNPKCAPSRASLLTGKHTWQLEEACNHFGIFPSKFEVYPDILEKAGYFVGYTGKGWAPGDWRQGGFNRNPAGPEYNEKKLTPPDNTCISDKDYTANFADFLEQKPDDKPFCFWYGGHEPHRPYEEGEGQRAGKDIEDVEVPSYFPDNEIVKNDLLDYAREIEWFDSHLGQMIDLLIKKEEFDNTLIIVTSDNGMPFPRVKGQMYEQDFHLPLALCWKQVTAGKRRVSDLINFIDLAPTFLEAAGLTVSSEMAGKSLINIIESEKSGLIDKERNRVFLGRERHDLGREDDNGYPVRCIRTRKHLYVRNFKPDRWPAGNPETGFTNCDSSPTKSLILKMHGEGGDDFYFNLAFGKRPSEELYNIIDDPECILNLANRSEYSELKQQLWQELKQKLKETCDPRIEDKGELFDNYEYTGDAPHSWQAYEEGKWKSQRF